MSADPAGRRTGRYARRYADRPVLPVRLNLTVVDPQTGRADLLLIAEPDDTVGAVAPALAQVLRGASADLVTAGGGQVIALHADQTTALYVDGRRLDPTTPLRSSPLREGVVVSLDTPDGCLLAEPAGLVELRVVSGPGAGAVHRLGAGDAEVGSGPHCPVRLVDPAVPAAGLWVTVTAAGAVQVRPGPSTEVRLDGELLDPAGAPWPTGALLSVGTVLLDLVVPEPPDAALEPSEDGAALDFNRPPRLFPAVRTTRFRLPNRPKEGERRPLPWLMALLPLVMAIAMAVLFKRFYYLLFGLLSPITFVGNALMDRKHGRQSFRRQNVDYRELRQRIEADATAALLQERTARRRDCPDPAAVLLTAVGPRRRLWERRRVDPDLLVLRLGTADLPSEVVLDDPERPEHDRQVTWTAPDVPVTVPLVTRGVLGIAGPGELARALGRWVVCQTAVLHSPSDLRIVVLTEPAGRDAWEWVRWLPHARPADGQDTEVLLGTDTETVARRVAELLSIVTARARVRGAGDAELDEPRFLVVLDGARRLRSLPGVVTLLRDGPRVGVHLVCLDTDERLLPEECQAVAVAGPDGLRVQQALSEVVQGVRPDDVSVAWANRVARALAPVRDVGAAGDDAALPTASRLLDVLGLEPPTAPAIAARWALSGRSTTVVVGESIDGPFALDLDRDGPHGLIAGTTGSGKSELLQTIVASLAVANRPDAMTFVLVDYKGGSAFKDCEHLPHTVGMVTDLDTHLVERALTSLSAELTRREHILAAAGTKDVQDYTRLVERDPAHQPLPRLLIVIDEFASMVRELPDFVTGLVNIAQRGRSLGIHLLLATQRPSGVVSADIRANTNLRIALRVTDATESSDVLDAPDAGRISKSTPGRAYVRLGHSSLVPFQTGRVGGRRPGTRSVSTDGPWVVELGWSRLGAPGPQRPVGAATEHEELTDLSELVRAVTGAAASAAVPPQHSPWLPALPDAVLLDALPGAGVAAGPLPLIPFGLEDLPAQQVQQVAALDLATFTHLLVVGAPRSGRSQLLRTIAGSAASVLSSADLHLYGVDCGNGALLALSDLPHCGAVVQRSQTERAMRLIARLAGEVDRRQAQLAESGYADITEQRAAAAPEQRLPHLLVLLDRWEGFTTTLGELDGGRLTDAILVMLREGGSVGVHLVITGDRSLLSGRISATTEDKLALRLADRADYTMLGLNPRKLPDDPVAGRAFRAETGVETQVALLALDVSGQGQAAALAAVGLVAHDRDRDVPRARRPFRVDVLPSQLSFEQAWQLLPGPVGPLFALVGAGGDELVAVGPDLAASQPSFVVAGPPKSGRSTVLVSMARSLLAGGSAVVLVAPRPSPLRDLAGSAGVLALFDDGDVPSEALLDLLNEAGTRPVAIVLDDAELLKECDAKEVLRAIVKGSDPLARAVVLAGNAEDVCSGFSGWQVEVRKNRQGALLSPQSMSDPDLIGARLPRSALGGPIQPGRALVHLGDGQVRSVQVPMVGPGR